MDRSEVALRYLQERTSKRIDIGQTPGEAVLNTLASIDPELYSKVLGDKQWVNIRLADSKRIETLWIYILDYYNSNKAWKEQ